MNGSTKALMGIVSGLTVLAIGSLLGFAISEAKSAQISLMEHEKMSGHPVLVERVANMDRDIKDIKATLKRIERNLKGR